MQLVGKTKKRGRPAFKPTRRMRDRVEIMVAGGLSASDVAVVIGVSRPTLEAHFADELKNGRVRKRVQILCMLDKAAKRGSVSAAKFLLTIFSDGPVHIGKKARRQQAAESACVNSEWGDDLHPTTEKLQ
jgi:hypothetical protein